MKLTHKKIIIKNKQGTQLVKCSPCKQKKPSSVTRTQKTSGLGVHTLDLILGRLRCVDPSGLLVSQSSGLGESHANERSVLKEKKKTASAKCKPRLSPALHLCMHTRTHMCTYTYEHTHRRHEGMKLLLFVM